MRSAVLAVCLLAGCATLEQETAEVRTAWQGVTYDEVVKRWGAPMRSATLQDGSQVHTWVSADSTRYGAGGPTVGIGGFRGGGGGGMGVGMSFPIGGSSTVESANCERTFTFKNGILAQQSWVGDPYFCNTFKR